MQPTSSRSANDRNLGRNRPLPGGRRTYFKDGGGLGRRRIDKKVKKVNLNGELWR